VLEEQRAVDLLDVDASVLDGLDRIGDFEELARIAEDAGR
jgi:hypothetical protein